MISITIEGNAQQVREEMRALLGQDREAPAETPVNEEPAKPTRKPRAAKTEASDPNPGASDAEPSASGTGAGDAPDAERDLSEKAMKERIVQYSSKAGPIALTEMQKQAGAENGKFSEVMTDPAAIAKLDMLLADAGF